MKLSWNYGTEGLNSISDVEVKVFATEMVYIPEGSFAAGDSSNSSGSIRNAAGGRDYIVVTDTISESFTSSPGTPGSIAKIDGLRGLDTNNDGIIENAHYPTGYKAFYCMKYELSQGQLTDFMNSFSVAPADSAVNLNRRKPWIFYPNLTNRNTIFLQDNVYYVTRPDRAAICNESTSLPFAVWACLRPMSEFEFEKACRGPLAPVPNEGAFGSQYRNSFASGYQVNGVENGTEKLNIQGNEYVNNKTFLNGDQGSGPFRVGIFATPTSNRQTSGAAYYGVMNLTDNMYEYVFLYNRAIGASDEIHGTGVLPMPASESGPYTTAPGWGMPGWKDNTVSGLIEVIDFPRYGFRGVRTAPQEN
ncbi:hypothetical protein [Chitinophaga sp. sic0106]|uniref:hypothetical protein n=1 Tax=Chitinophaga sp. sic0106 TaxID=2854785 RepID=UPI001C454280|nr:hypothetical protein [Chitinophaga sp. sic0106]MBV7529015.1 hypothetical protein [Chitinophaga sp. sic0106]